MCKSNLYWLGKKHMFSKTTLWFLFLIVGFGDTKKLQGQDERTDKYAWFDNMIGQTNSGVFKGVVYDKEFRVINDKHQFFQDSDFIIGDVVINQQSYLGLQLRYDVYHDQLVVDNFEVIGPSEMILDKNKVSAFQLGKHVFEKVNALNIKGTRLSGFVEVLVSTDMLILLKKHKKKILKKTEDDIVFFEFKDLQQYFVRNDNEYYPIKKSTDLIALFPEHKRSLKQIHDEHALLKKTDTDRYFEAIVLDFAEVLRSTSIKP